MAKTDVQHDVIVIGAGIAGLVAANRAAQLGKRVIILEKSKEEKYLCNSRYTYGPERNSRSSWPLACRSSKRPSVAITC